MLGGKQGRYVTSMVLGGVERIDPCQAKQRGINLVPGLIYGGAGEIRQWLNHLAS